MTIEVVTPEDLKKAVEDVKDDFRKQLHALQRGHAALQEELDRQAEELQKQPWSPQMENILGMIAAERKVNEDRFMRLGVNAAGGIAPSPFDLDQLMLSFEKKYKLSEQADRLTEVERKLAHASGRIDDAATNATAAIQKANEAHAASQTAQERADEAHTIASGAASDLGQWIPWLKRTMGIDSNGNAMRFESIEARLDRLERKGNFPLAPIFISAVVLMLVFAFFGIPVDYLIIDAIAGFAAGGIIGIGISALLGRLKKRRTNNPPAQTPSS